MRESDKEYYTILGVSKDASPKEITTAYRKLAMQYHPDVNPSDEAKERMPLLNEAYAVLGDADQRRKYDTGTLSTSTTTTMVIYRTGASVGVTRKMDVYLNGVRMGRIPAGGSMSFVIQPGKHKLRVKLDMTSSPVVRFSCKAGMTVGFAAGARSITEYFFRSVASPEKALFIQKIL